MNRTVASLAPLLAAWACVVAVAVVAWLAGRFVPLLGGAALALILGAVLRWALPFPQAWSRAFAGIGTRLLQVSIVLLGASVGLVEVLTVAGGALPVMLVTVFAGLALIWILGRRLAVPSTRRGLLAVGTSICGASAIAAAAPALEASAAEVSYAVSVVFLFNFVAVVLFPIVGHAAGMSATAFATWAGTAVNDTSSVLAASAAFGSAAIASATVVKLARTVMILPVTLVIALVAQRERGDAEESLPIGRLLRRAVPWFAVVFVLGSALNSVGLIGPELAGDVGALAGLGVIGALAAVGLSTDARAIRQAGPRPLLLAGTGWLAIACLSLVVQGLLTLA
ncbi:MAG TPA: putative sulfate exporter family transporter [Candidatus Limnocylindrales bacterium]|nr:putative sulfate exporter family transporter [Candidatus Limnocylindrales bacterium]